MLSELLEKLFCQKGQRKGSDMIHFIIPIREVWIKVVAMTGTSNRFTYLYF